MLMIERDGKLAESTMPAAAESTSPPDQRIELFTCTPANPRSLLDRLSSLVCLTFAAAGLRRLL